MNNKVFTYWENEAGKLTPPYIKACIDSIKMNCKEFVLLTPDNINQFIDKDELNPNWRSLPYIAQHADCIRVAIINKYGGWWIDADTCFLRPIELVANFIDESKEFSFFQWIDGRVLNGYFYAKSPNSSVTSDWLESINKILSNPSQMQWTSLGESILTPLVKWKYKPKCQLLDRNIFLPINFDKIPYIFFEDVTYRMFIRHNTVAVGLNHSWLLNNVPTLQTKMISEIKKSVSVLSQILTDAEVGYQIAPVDTALQTVTQHYSYGSISIGDIYVLVNMFAGLKHVLEIGTNQGTTTRLLAGVCRHVTTVDVFEDLDKIKDEEWRKFYKNTYKNKSRSFSDIQSYLSNCKNVSIIKSESTIYLNTISDDYFDGIFFDGDHSRNGISNDFECGKSKVRIGGIYLFHDCNLLHNEVNDFYNDVLVNDDSIEEIHYVPTTFYTSIKIFRRVK